MSHSTIIIHSTSPPASLKDDALPVTEKQISVTYSVPDHLTPEQIGEEVCRIYKLANKITG